MALSINLNLYDGPPVPPGGGSGGSSGGSSSGSGGGQPQETFTPNGNGGGTYTYTTAPDGVSGGAFDYLYQYTTAYPGIIKSLTFPEGDKLSSGRGLREGESAIYSTNITKWNPYYTKAGHTTPAGESGKATAIYISKSNREGMWTNAGKSLSTYPNQIAAKLDGSPSAYTVLPNCVGFVNGRSYEVWGLALKSGYLKKVGDDYVIPSLNNKKVHKFKGVPNCNAYSFNFKSIYDGTPDSTGYYRSKSPIPGAILCWRKNNDDGQPGHVGFVEAVYKPGTPEEYCITSESGYSGGGVQYLVWTGRRFKSQNYKYNSYPMANFLCSPICELASYGGGGNVTIGDIRDVTYEEAEALEEERENYSGQNILADVPEGSKVEIQWFGNENADNTGKRINKMGCVAVVLTKDLTKACPFGLSFDNKKVFGYYQREAIKMVDKSDIVETGSVGSDW